MSREIKDIKITDSMGKVIETGKAIPVESLSCAFCGNHICPGTSKIYYQVPLSSNVRTVFSVLCSIRCIQSYYVTDERDASTISVIQLEAE